MKESFNPFMGMAIVILLTFSSAGCSNKLLQALRSGQTDKNLFYEEIAVEKQSGLLILPVSISGKTYRFLFDTGAPFSISRALQGELGYSRITKTRFTDSDGNSDKADIVRVNEIRIGQVPFKELGAFVLDMSANPIIRCMDIDGIIGSNLMRLCNWEIDMENLIIRFSNNPDSLFVNSTQSLPFYTDFQYNINLSLTYDSSKSMSVRLDYGSNGYLSLEKHRFQYLKKNHIFDQTHRIIGFTQSGIVGKKEQQIKEMAYTNAFAFSKMPIDSIILKSGNSPLLGTGLLSRYVVGIDFMNNKLYLRQNENYSIEMKIMGINLSYSKNKGFYILSVVEGSPAHKNGIRPEMEIISIDDLTFSPEEYYCDFIERWVKRKDSLSMSLRTESGKILDVKLRKEIVRANAQ